MPSFILNDVQRGLWVDSLSIDAETCGFESAASYRWSVTKRTLRGGRRDGVDLIELDNGLMRMAIVPTRGMGLWRGTFRGLHLGWESPVRDGPVNPAFVNLLSQGGIGWLEGFDELMVRCGLQNNGAPYQVKSVQADGSESHTTFGLHGRIANIPASYVAVHIADEPPHEIVVEGHVEEAWLFGPQIRMVTTISTTPGSNRLTVRDEFVNLKDQPVEMQLLYHWNFGPPFLEAGSRFVAPIETLTPRDARAQEGLDRYDLYNGPVPGFVEQCYFGDLLAESGRTFAMLHNSAKDKAVVLRYRKDELPAFTLWKNTGGLRDGYVTGLEPGTNFPSPRPFEAERGRIVTIPVDGRFIAETCLDVLVGEAAVAAVAAEAQQIQAGRVPVVNPRPMEPFAAG
jgi:hypothetical protein